MADVGQDHDNGGQKGKPKKLSTHIDFTPMVDLGFLLITFFMLATTLVKPQTMEIALPSKDKVADADKTKIKASRAITIILGKNNKVFYYEGTQLAGVDPKIVEVDYSPKGLRKYLVGRNLSVVTKMRELKDKNFAKKMDKLIYEKSRTNILSEKGAPIVIIKPSDGSSYRNLVDVLDEMAICSIGSYAIVDITPYDLGLIKNLNN
jgi:biopolymer transport protein ExbD